METTLCHSKEWEILKNDKNSEKSQIFFAKCLSLKVKSPSLWASCLLGYAQLQIF